ncbi:MAG: enoyl-CoA hydratase/isomerase family protein, partial [Clostridiales bacterium]|nr:enoyl-CoA hydratase/isomerase family protein [Clostridiales bacterium]
TAGTESSRALSSKEIEALENQADASTSALRDVVEKLIVGQKSSSTAFTLSIEILTVAGSAGPADISQDPEWGVEAVSNRIVEFAKSISGGDPGKLEMLRDAIDKGFASAKNQLGGKLPSVSMDTYDAVMQKLDDWAAESQPAPTE